MSIQVSVLAQNAQQKIVRPTASFHPSIWGDRFLNYTVGDLRTEEHRQEQIEELKEVVRKEVFGVATRDVSNQMKLIDAVQRLGLSYHFEKEIEEALKCIYVTNHGDDDPDLYDVSLHFRLLRQHGYYVSCDIFDKFKEENGNFKECLIGDIHGLLSLYEASHFRLHGEETLEKALVFTTSNLESLASQMSNIPLAEKISCALERPLQKSLERLQARHYISIYQDEPSHNKALLQLAKLDFNHLQSMHKQQLSEISRWWKELDFSSKLPIRDRIVESYFWVLGMYFEPQYSLGRKCFTKVIALSSILDDIYDAYGTFEELELFTEAIQRWDVNSINKLPQYMQLFYRTILNVFEELETEVTEEERYRVHYVKEAFKSLARTYFDEAKWLHQGYIPTIEEYLRVALPSTGLILLAAASLVGMGDIVTKDVFEWLFNDPKIARASALICRLMDDIAGHKFEQERKHVASSVECYIKQYGVTEKEVRDVFNKKVENAWIDINEEFVRPTEVPTPVLTRVLNFAKVMDLLYKEDDGYTRVGKVTKDGIAALLINPVPL